MVGWLVGGWVSGWLYGCACACICVCVYVCMPCVCCVDPCVVSEAQHFSPTLTLGCVGGCVRGRLCRSLRACVRSWERASVGACVHALVAGECFFVIYVFVRVIMIGGFLCYNIIIYYHGRRVSLCKRVCGLDMNVIESIVLSTQG